LRLVRVRIGNFWLGDLPPGQWRALTAAEIKWVHPGSG
jgi:16S rRNA U516 pseudouridylate synthase RsuA-like enzyme